MNRKNLRNKLGKKRDNIKDDAPKSAYGSGKYLKTFDYKASGLEKFKLVAKKKHHVNFLPFPVKTNKHPLYKDLIKEQGEDPVDWFIKYYRHTVKTAGGNTHFICPNKTYGKPCPYCEEQSRLNTLPGGYDAHKDEINAVKPSKERRLFVVQDVDDGKLYVMDQSDWFFWNELQEDLEEAREENEDIFLPIPDEDGVTVSFYVKPSSLGDDSKGNLIPGECKKFKFVERGEAIPEELLDDIPAIDAFLHVYTYDEIASFLDGSYFASDDDDEDEEEEDEDEIEEDDEDEELDDDEDEDEEEDESDPPSKRTRRRERKKPETKECPAGGKFGEDFDMYDECVGCPLEDACEKEYEDKYAD